MLLVLKLETFGPQRSAGILLAEPFSVPAEDEGLGDAVHVLVQLDLAEVVSTDHGAERDRIENVLQRMTNHSFAFFALKCPIWRQILTEDWLYVMSSGTKPRTSEWQYRMTPLCSHN